MSKELLIVFVKNMRFGKVKTRLAKDIGNKKAFEVYKELVNITKTAINGLIIEKRIYYSDSKNDKKELKTSKFVQKGADLGKKMQNSFEKGFNDGFEKIVLIGSDLPDMSPQIIQQGFDELNHHEVVFGPAEDGGYYLVGMTKKHYSIFQNKKWSTSNLLSQSLKELEDKNIKFSLLKTFNDIDTFEDLKNSKLNQFFNYL